MTNESTRLATIQIPRLATFKLEPSDDNVFVLSNSKDDVCVYVDLLDTTLFSSKSIDSTPLTFPLDQPKTPYNPMYMRLFRQVTPSQRPPIHCPYPSSIDWSIVQALILTKSRIRSDMHLWVIHVGSIVKYWG